MARPHVVIFNAQSLDGRLDGFAVDVGLFYALAARLPCDAVLAGSQTIVTAAKGAGVDLGGADEPGPRGAPDPGDRRPLLAIVDSRGQVTRFDWLLDQPHWRDVVVLCAAATPPSHLARLDRRGIRRHVVGEARVDLAAALEVLGDAHGVRTVRVDAGPGLNGALLDAGLVDEAHVLIAPCIAGSADGPALHLAARGPDAAARPLSLLEVRRERDDHLWLRYRVD